MKKFLLAILIVLMASTAWAMEPIDWSKSYSRNYMVSVGAATPAVGTCSTVYHETSGGTDDFYLGSADPDDGRYYVGLATVADTTAPVICKVQMRMKIGAGDVSGKTFNVVIKGLTGFTTICTSSNVSGAVLTSSYAWVDFAFSPSCTMDGDENDLYFILATMNGVDATNHAYMSGSLSNTDGGYASWVRYYANGTYGSGDTGYDIDYKIYK